MTAPIFDNASGETWNGSTGSFTHACNVSAGGIAIGIIHAQGGLTAGNCTFDGASLIELHLSDRLWIGFLLLPNIGTKNVVFGFTGGGQKAYTFLTISFARQEAPTILGASSDFSHDAYGGGAVGANDMAVAGANANNVDNFDSRTGGYIQRATWSWATNYIAGVDTLVGAAGNCYYDWLSNQNCASFGLQIKDYIPVSGTPVSSTPILMI